MPQFEISPTVLKHDLFGLFPNMAARLYRMARRSAPVTHKDGNRRFEDYILKVGADKVVQRVVVQPSGRPKWFDHLSKRRRSKRRAEQIISLHSKGQSATR